MRIIAVKEATLAEQHRHLPFQDAGRELRVLPSQFAIIEDHFGLTSPEDVHRFLLDRPHLVQLLREAFDVVQSYFGHETPVTLSVRDDPEIPDQQELIASIQTTESADAVLARLQQFDEDWWFDAATRANGDLVISIEPV